jgi:hypothetical protein
VVDINTGWSLYQNLEYIFAATKHQVLREKKQRASLATKHQVLREKNNVLR